MDQEKKIKWPKIPRVGNQTLAILTPRITYSLRELWASLMKMNRNIQIHSWEAMPSTLFCIMPQCNNKFKTKSSKCKERTKATNFHLQANKGLKNRMTCSLRAISRRNGVLRNLELMVWFSIGYHQTTRILTIRYRTKSWQIMTKMILPSLNLKLKPLWPHL